MMTKDLLLITGENKISIINVNNYKLRIINVPEADYILGVCILNQNMLLTGDAKGIIYAVPFISELKRASINFKADI